MSLLVGIRGKFAARQYEFSKHALDQMLIRTVLVSEVEDAVATGEIIEDYPHDKYGPSCLILGFTRQKRPLHLQCSYPSRPLIKIVTIYEPDPIRWINFRERKP